MKKMALVPLFGFMCAVAAMAGINIPSDGSDGGLYLTNNTVIDLSKAVTGNWDDNNSANAGKGIYDSNKWAIVFKYTNVFIGANATVTFSNHPSRAPVVWLVSGNVTVDGTVSLDGEYGLAAPSTALGGPGGFPGGMGQRVGVSAGAGRGIGGGGGDVNGGGHGTFYGNASVLPLVGGSGGGGNDQGGGGGGAGAILIATRVALRIEGVVCARGGAACRNPGSSATEWPGYGSGGGIRLVAETFLGNGTVTTTGNGGDGRIRIERVSGSGSQVILPTPSLVALDPGATPLLWLPDEGPTARIVSIGGVNAPREPRAVFGLEGVDIQLFETSSVPVVVETRNVEQNSQVIVRVTPLANGTYSTANATVQQIVSNNPPVILWRANIPTGPGYSAVQVRVVRP